MNSYISICITGVDGTGKSTVVNSTKNLFQHDKAIIQYMGLKNWESRFSNMCFNTNDFFIRKLQTFGVIYELRYRIRKHKNENKVVIFDRYTYEQYLEEKEKKKSLRNVITSMLYKFFLFDFIYKPTVTVYLTCNIEKSIERKNDIKTQNEIQRLMEVKNILDLYYMI